MSNGIIQAPFLGSIALSIASKRENKSDFDLSKTISLALIYLILEDSVKVMNSTAITTAKQMAGNGALQHDIVGREARLKPWDIPDPIKVQHRSHHRSFDPHFHNGLLTLYTTWTNVWSTIANIDDIAEAKVQNNIVAGKRSILTQRLMDLQQEAQMKENNMEITSNSVSMTVREAASLLQKVLLLTLNALMRKKGSF
ncbi:MAG: DUF720 domain-containing protein [Chlamydiales bacterium]